MDSKMTAKTQADAQRVIVAFLREVAQPAAKDWDALLSRYPQFAAEIVNAAIADKNKSDFDSVSDIDLQRDEVYARTVSKAVNRVYERSSSQLRAAQEKVSAFQGPAVRTLCADLSIPHPALLSGVLAGTIRPPNKLLRRLSSRIEVPLAALREVFSQSFGARALPAFKSRDGKPSVVTQPATWEDAVRSLSLSDEETKSLLAWSTEG